MYESGKGISELSGEYGVGKSTIDSLIKKFRIITTSTGEVTNNDEILKLKKEFQQVQMENGIDTKEMARLIQFIIDTPSDVMISEGGIKNINN